LLRAVPAGFEKIAASWSGFACQILQFFQALGIRQEFGIADCFQPTQTLVGFFCDEANL